MIPKFSVKSRQGASPEFAQLLKELQRDWNQMGEENPIGWTIGNPAIHLDQYFEYGRLEIVRILSRAAARGVRPTSGRALDFGCGIGRLTRALGSIYSEVHGLDISPSMIDRAKALNAKFENCHFQAHSNHRLNVFNTDYFDLIVAINVFPYIPAVLANGYVQEFIRLLKPGGLLYFQMAQGAFPRTLFPDILLRLYRRWKHEGNPLLLRADRFHIGERTVRRVLSESGANILDVESQRTPTLWIHYGVLATKG